MSDFEPRDSSRTMLPPRKYRFGLACVRVLADILYSEVVLRNMFSLTYRLVVFSY